jgi:drug/metabolite transporter (DMT)-like permease
VFIYTAPLFAACGLHWLVPGERLSGRQWLGMVLAASGVVCAFLVGKPSGGTSWQGDLIGLIGGACWGATTVLIRRSALAEAPPLRTLFYQLAVTGVVLLALALPLGKRLDLARLDSLAWSSLAFQVFIVAGISLLGWFVLLSRYRAAPLGVLTLLTPLFGVLMGVWLLGETPGPGFLAGAALVLSGLLIVSYPSRSRAAPR